MCWDAEFNIGLSYNEVFLFKLDSNDELVRDIPFPNNIPLRLSNKKHSSEGHEELCAEKAIIDSIFPAFDILNEFPRLVPICSFNYHCNGNNSFSNEANLHVKPKNTPRQPLQPLQPLQTLQEWTFTGTSFEAARCQLAASLSPLNRIRARLRPVHDLGERKRARERSAKSSCVVS